MASSLPANADLALESQTGRPDLPSAAPPGLSAPPSLESMWHALRRHWVLALSLGLLAGLAGGGVAWCLAPAPYVAQTLLEIGPRANRPAEGDENILTYQRTQTALLKSYGVLQSTLERPSVAALSEVRGKSDPTAWLTKALLTDSLLGPEIIRVSLNGDNADDLATLLNELVRVYVKEAAHKEDARIRERMKQLRENYRECADKLRERRQTLIAREEALGIDDPETLRLRQTTTMQQLVGMQTKRIDLQLQYKQAQIELDGLRDLVKHPERIAISDFAIGEELKLDAVMKKNFDRLTEIETKVQQFRHLAVATNNTNANELKRLEQERGVVQKAMSNYQASMLESVVSRLRSKQVTDAKENILKLERTLQSAKDNLHQVEGDIRRLEVLVSSLRGAGRPLDKSTSGVDALRDEVTQMEAVLKKVGEELGNLQVELPARSRVTQLEPAKPPTVRKRDRQYKVAGAVGFGLFGLVFVGVGLLEFRTRRVYLAEDVGRGLGLPLLGTLPNAPTESVQPRQQTLLAEAADAVRTRLLHAARHESRQVVLITSAVAGEGKTSLAGTLALSLARSSHKTLLIDGDLRSPGVHQRFGLPAQPGLAEVLRGEAAVDQLIQPTAFEGLSVLTAGRCDRRAIQALARDGMKKLLAQLKGQYEFILLDACPVLPVADALLLAQHADAVVLAVLRNVSRLPAVYEAQHRLASLDIPVLGAIVLGENANSYGAERYLEEMKSGAHQPAENAG